MNTTSIEWTATPMPDGTIRPGFSANPLKYRRKSDGKSVWACVKVSPGCANCYSEATALRFSRGKLFTAANMEEVVPFVDAKEVHKILTAQMVDCIPVAGSKCFLGDMTDIFGEWVNDHTLDTLFRMMCERKDLIFQLLTKRPNRAMKYFNDRWSLSKQEPWLPPTNIWLGTSVENQVQADKRLPHLLATNAAVRFVSYEPALGPVDPSAWLHGIHWVICGGESGNGSRPCNLQWIRDVVLQCLKADVPVFVKQLGRHYYQQDTPDAELSHVFPANQKGGDAATWPTDLRVRQFPTPKRERIT